MSCRKTRRLFSAYEDNELPLALRMRVNSHVLRCESCRQALAASQRRADTLREAFASDLSAPADLTSSVLLRVRRECPTRERAVPREIGWRRPLWGATGSLALAGATALAMFLTNGLSRLTPSPTPPTQQATEPSQPTPAAPERIAALPPVDLPDSPTLEGARRSDLDRHWARLGQNPLPEPSPARQSLPDPKPEEPETPPVPAPEPPAGRVREVDGTLMAAKASSAGSWEVVAADYALKPSHSLKTGEGSLVALDLKGGIEIRANADTELVTVSVPDDPREPWVLRLVRGELWAKVPGEGHGIEIETAAGRVIASRGELYIHAVAATKATEMLVLEGRALLTNDYDLEPVWTTAGMETVARLDQRPTPPTEFERQRLRQLQWAYLPILPGRDGRQSFWRGAPSPADA